MRRLIASLLLLVSPAAAFPQAAGKMLFDGVETPTVNRAACGGGGDLALRWHVVQQTGATAGFVPSTGAFAVFAAAADKTDAFPFCHYVGDGSAVAVGAVLKPSGDPLTIPDPPLPLVDADQPATIASLVAGPGLSCDQTAVKTIYVCVTWSDAAGVKAYAKGQVKLDVLAPNPPSVAEVRPGNEALEVDLTDNGGPATATAWQARAVAGGVEQRSTWSGSKTNLRIEGLRNFTDYMVTARARSAAGNESDWSTTGLVAAPQPSAGLGQVYERYGGRDSGGCQSGSAGWVALLGAGALLRLRRRG